MQESLMILPDDIIDPVMQKHSHMLTCSICLMLLRDPVECKRCQTQFCQSCASKWKQERQRCPVRCRPFDTQPSHKFVRTMLDELTIKCPRSEIGCDTIVRYTGLNSHTNVCGFVEVVCPGGECQVLRKDFQQHYAECGLVKITCEYCHEGIQRFIFQNHLDEACDKFPTKCQHCSRDMERGQVDEHIQSECPLAPISCQHCNNEVIRNKMDKHFLFCDDVPVKCSGFKFCKTTVPRWYIFDHESECQFSKVLCEKLCGQMLKRDEVENHDCIEFLKSKL